MPASCEISNGPRGAVEGATSEGFCSIVFSVILLGRLRKDFWVDVVFALSTGFRRAAGPSQHSNLKHHCHEDDVFFPEGGFRAVFGLGARCYLGFGPFQLLLPQAIPTDTDF